MSVAGVILAAGESRRMGFPKALLAYQSETFLDRLIGRLAARCDPVIVVLGAGAEQIRARVVRPATFVINADYLRGMTTSLQCALQAVPPQAEGVLFTLVDHPAVAGATVDALWAPPGPEAGELLRVPRYGGARGHPIWFSRELIPEFLAIAEGGAANEVVHRHRAETRFLDLDDPGIVADIDDPQTYRQLTGAGV